MSADWPLLGSLIVTFPPFDEYTYKSAFPLPETVLSPVPINLSNFRGDPVAKAQRPADAIKQRKMKPAASCYEASLRNQIDGNTKPGKESTAHHRHLNKNVSIR